MAQTSPQHADPHGLGAILKKTIQEIDVDRHVVDHPCGGGKFSHGPLEKSLTNVLAHTEILTKEFWGWGWGSKSDPQEFCNESKSEASHGHLRLRFFQRILSKGQQLKGKIVSALFPDFFHILSPLPFFFVGGGAGWNPIGVGGA